MRKFTVRDITLAALIAAAYVVLTFGIPLPMLVSNCGWPRP